jgi:hypothetical protein
MLKRKKEDGLIGGIDPNDYMYIAPVKRVESSY